jgi:hypothetical protein
MNSQDAFYANDLVYKGKPLFIEFPVKASDTASTLATRIKRITKKYLLLMMGTEKILEVKSDDVAGTITLEGVNGYQQIKKANVQVWKNDVKTVDCCTYEGDYVDIITGVPTIYKIDTDSSSDTYGKAISDSTTTEGDNDTTIITEYKLTENGKEAIDKNTEVAILPGLEAFGDYNWLIHNLRLPTAANYYPWSPANRMGEMPVPG